MKLEEILRSLPSREDIAAAVGIETRASASTAALGSVGLLGTGIVLGAGLALLFAPKVGSELRHSIADGVGAVAVRLRKGATEAGSECGEPSAMAPATGCS